MTDRWTFRVTQHSGETFDRDVVDRSTIGRGASNTIALDDSAVSGNHAIVELDGGVLKIRDRGSNNGTVVDGRQELGKDQSTALRAGMRLTLGRSEVLVLKNGLDREAAPPAAAAGTLPRTPPADPAPPAAIDATLEQAAPPQPRQPISTPMPAEHGVVDPLEKELGRIDTLVPKPGPAADAATLNKLRESGARLLILDEVNRRAETIGALTTTVGRSNECDCILDSQSVSNVHAQIEFVSQFNSFQVKDLGSANGTSVQRANLTPQLAQPLTSDALVRFGPIEAVFRTEQQPDLEPIAESFDLAVAKRLVARRKLDKKASIEARKVARAQNRRLGDELLLTGLVSGVDWSVAAEEERLRPSSEPGAAIPWIVIALLVFAAVAYFALGGGS